MTELPRQSNRRRLRWPDWMFDKPDSPYRVIKGWVLGASFVLAAVVFIVGIAVPVLLVDRRNCAYAARQYDRPTRWDLWAGCYIESGGRFISLDKYIAITEDR